VEIEVVAAALIPTHVTAALPTEMLEEPVVVQAPVVWMAKFVLPNVAVDNASVLREVRAFVRKLTVPVTVNALSNPVLGVQSIWVPDDVSKTPVILATVLPLQSKVITPLVENTSRAPLPATLPVTSAPPACVKRKVPLVTVVLPTEMVPAVSVMNDVPVEERPAVVAAENAPLIVPPDKETVAVEASAAASDVVPVTLSGTVREAGGVNVI